MKDFCTGQERNGTFTELYKIYKLQKFINDKNVQTNENRTGLYQKGYQRINLLKS